MFNHVGLLGRLAQEPEIRYTQSGVPVASFDLAVQVPSKDKNTPPDYIPITCWDKQAEVCRALSHQGPPDRSRWPDLHPEIYRQRRKNPQSRRSQRLPPLFC